MIAWSIPHKKVYLSALVLILALTVLSILYWKINNKPFSPSPNATVSSSPYRMKIERLRFYGMNDGQKVLHLAADSFVIEKKKIGFLTFSVAHVARLENAVIDAYVVPSKGGTLKGPLPKAKPSMGIDGQASRTKSVPHGESLSGTRSPSSAPLSFSALLAEETFSGFPVPLGNISTVEAAPILVRFYDGDRLMSTVTASGATILFKERSILFSGHVRVRTGAAELTTEQLSFRPEQGRLETEGPYSLQRAGTITSGSRLTTDIQLRAIRR